MDKDILDSAVHGHRGYGQADLINYLKGKRLTQREAIKAKCYDCSGMGEDDTCTSKECSLWPYSYYGGMKPASKRATLPVSALRTGVCSEKDSKEVS